MEPDLNDVLTPKESTTPLKVLLIQPPIEDFYTTPIRFYPLGLLYVAGVLEKMGYRVQILDCLTPLKKRQLPLPKCFHYLEPFLQEHSFPFKAYFRFGISEETMLSRIRGFAPDMIGISAQFTAYFETVQTLAALIKRNFTVPVFIGGNHATVLSEAIKQRTNNIDFVVKGLAEQCLPAFFQPQNPQLATDVPGLDWTEIPPAHYLLKGNDYTIGRNNYISLIASRGCPFDCDFCNVRIMFGREIRYRTIDRVIKEMRWNYINKTVRIFNFEDDNLSYLWSWFLEFLQAVIDDPVLKDIELTAMNGICYPTLDEELLEKMEVAGFKRLNLSYVTKDTSLQQQYHRPRHSSNFETVIRTAQNLGLLVTVYVIIGLPGQTHQEIKATIDYLLGLKVLVGPSVFYLTPGSSLYRQMDLAPEVLNEWNLYRSSAFAIETEHLSRAQLIELFSYTREKNLANKNN